MSSQDNLSNELFYQVHRGLPTGKKHHIKKALGMHWSSDRGIAHRFSEGSTAFRGSTKYGAIIHANVPMSSVETDPRTLWEHRVVQGDVEQEVPVKKGAKVFVTGVTKRKGDKTRTRRYNPPRERTA